MTNPNAFNVSTTISFVIKNNSTINRSIKIFNTKLNPGGTLDLMKIPGITEEDIRSEVLKGALNSLLSSGALKVISSTVNFSSADPSQNAFLASIGLSGSSSEVNVANIAALSAINDSNQNNYTVMPVTTVLQSFMLDKNSTATVDGISVVATLSGTGRWLRQLTHIPTWTSQTTWYQSNATGNDENNGATSGTPVKTIAEIVRRLPVADAVIYTINVLDTVVSTDNVRFNPMISTLGSNFVNQEQAQFLITGPLVTPSSSTGTFSTTSATSGNVQASVGGGFGAAQVGFQLEVTSGAALGARAMVLKDLGSGTVRVGEFKNPITGALTAFPAPSDGYKVLALPVFSAPILCTGLTSRVGLTFQNLTISSAGSGVVLSQGEVQFLGCRITVPLQPPPQNFPIKVFIRGCAVHLAALGNFCQTSIGQGPGTTGSDFLNCRIQVAFSAYHIVQDCTFQNSTLRTTDNQRSVGGMFDFQGKLGFFDVPTLESAITLKRGSSAQARNGAVIYGTGAVAGSRYGIEVLTGGAFYYDTGATLTITNTTGDLNLEGSGTALPGLEASAGGSLPAASALTTWANLSAAPFNGNAMNYTTSSRFTKTAS